MTGPHPVLAFLKKEGLLSEERIELLLSWQENTGFSAHNAVTVEPEDPDAVERLARYLLRPALSLERMSFDGKQGVVHYRRKRPGRFASAVKAFDPLDFLARPLMHVPEPRLHTVRYYGRYANVVRARSGDPTEETAGAEAPAGEGAETDTVAAAERRRLRRQWAQMIRRVYELDPLTYPHCGSEMKILSFLLDPPVVRRILDHLAQHRGAEARDPPLPHRLAS